MSIRRHLIPGLVQLLVLPLGLLPAPTPAGEQQPFRIEIVDQSTGRGVPLVELRTVANAFSLTAQNLVTLQLYMMHN